MTTKIPLFDIRPFKRAGVFAGRPSEGRVERAWTVAFPNFAGVAAFDVRAQRLQITTMGSELFSIDVTTRPGAKGSCWYFLPPCCGQVRNEFVRENYETWCLSCFRAHIDHRSKSFRSAMITVAKHELATALRQDILIHPYDIEIMPPIAPLKRASRRDPIPKSNEWRRRDFRTETAMDRGKGLGQEAIYAEFIRHPTPYWIEASANAPERPPLKNELIDGYPILDLRVLRARADWPLRGVDAQTLTWGAEYPPLYEVALFKDAREGEVQIFLAHNWRDPEKRTWQWLEVVFQTNGRVRFVCPINGGRYDSLFERHGFFASKDAQNLKHLSQRASGKLMLAKKKIAGH